MRGSTSARTGILVRQALRLSLLVLPLLTVLPAEAQHRDGEGNISMAMVGDLIITRALMPYDEPEFLKLRDLIGGSTMGFGNMEMLLHEYVARSDTGLSQQAMVDLKDDFLPDPEFRMVNQDVGSLGDRTLKAVLGYDPRILNTSPLWS